MDADVEAFLNRLSPQVRPRVRALRVAVQRAVPRAAESCVWGALSYHRPWVGGRVKGAVCQIVVRNGAVRLDFIHGIRLADPQRLLRGDAKSKRFVPINSATGAGQPAVAALIRAAAALDPTTWA